jgi:hypothetical protein
MNALTYEIRNAAALVAATRPVKPASTEAKGFMARLWDAFVESRMRQAEREIRMHLHLIPEDVLAKSGYAATYKDADKLPFVK